MKSNSFPIKSLRQLPVGDCLGGGIKFLDGRKLIGLLPIAGEMRKLEVRQVRRVSAL